MTISTAAQASGKRIEKSIKQDWDVTRMRNEFSKFITCYKMAIWNTLLDRPELINPVLQALIKNYTAFIKSSGITTSEQLVQYMAEMIVNLAGGEASVRLNGDSATLVYESHPMWEELSKREDMQKMLSDEKRPLVMEATNNILQSLAQSFGCSATFAMTLNKPLMEITFTRT